jgi:hypothetical protein
MGAILVRDVVAYGVSVLALGYVIYVMLHPEVDGKSASAPGDSSRAATDASVLRWCAEQWRLREAERDNRDCVELDDHAAVSGVRR